MKQTHRLSLEGDTVDLLEASGGTILPVPEELPPEVQAQLDAVVPVDEGVEGELLNIEAEDASAFDDEQTAGAVLESLHVYAAELEHLIATGTGTNTTADLITIGISQQLARLNAHLPKTALEGASDATHRHQLALEGLGDVMGAIGQAYVLGYKSEFAKLVDFFKTKQGLVAKYGAKFEKASAELVEKRSGFKQGEHKVSLAVLANFFITDKGFATELAKASAEDSAASEYILTKYPAAVLDTMKKLATALKSRKVSSLADLENLAGLVQKLPHPSSLFDKKYLQPGKPYLGRMGLELQTGTSRVAVGGGEGGKLAALGALATPSTVVETGRFTPLGLGSAKDMATGKAKKEAVVPFAKYSEADIATVIASGKKYLASADAYLKMGDEFKRAGEEVLNASLSLMNPSSEPGEVRAAKVVISQIDQYAKNLLRAVRSPATAELSRALKGAKYCQFAALRMIHHAK